MVDARPPTPWVELIRLRDRAKLEPRQLAAAVNIGPTHMSYLERGLRRPSNAVLYRLATVLNIDASELRETMPTPPTQRRYLKPEDAA